MTAKYQTYSCSSVLVPDLSCPSPDPLPTPFFFADLYFKPNAKKGFAGYGVRIKVEWDGIVQPPAFKLR